MEKLPRELILIVLDLLDVSSCYSLSATSKFYAALYRYHTTSNRSSTVLDAVYHRYETLFRWLLPDEVSISVCVKNDICKTAAAVGSLEILKYVHQKQNIYINEIMTKPNKPFDIIEEAIGNGHLEIVKWCRANGWIWGTRLCDCAALNGHFEILQWLVNNGCPMSSSTCANAAENGHIEILKWLHENECDWDETSCDNAALNGHWDILKYLHENGYGP